jgi:hypothetical protein
MPVLLGSDPEDHSILVDGDKRMKLAYGIVGNTYSEGNKMFCWDVPYDVNGDGKYGQENENVANAYFTHLYVYVRTQGRQSRGHQQEQREKASRHRDPHSARHGSGRSGGAQPAEWRPPALHR